MEQGLTSAQAAEKLVTFGKNEIKTQQRLSALRIFLSQFPTIINGLLFLAAIFSFVLGDNIDGIFILAILLINGAFGFVQQYRAEKSLEKLKNFLSPLTRVLRDGKETQIETMLIVPGDIVILSEGDRVPADGILIFGNHIEIDESLLTGESLPVVKKENDDILSGTLVIKGRGKCMVQKTGMQTRLGTIAHTLSEIESDKAPLVVRIEKLGKMLSIVACGIAMLLIPIGIAQGKELFPLILLATTIAIAAIPEGLPAVITIALALGTNRMAKKHAIVRSMPAVETLGAVQIILVDKTGTLTQNNMKVKTHVLHSGAQKVDMLRACVLGNTASLVEKSEVINTWEAIGDKTDGALLLWAKAEHEDFDTFVKTGKIVDEYVFDPATNTVTTVWEEDAKQPKQYVFVRGAPEVVLAKSTMSEKEKVRVARHFQEYAKAGLRVIGFGVKELKAHTKNRNDLETNLAFVGFVGLYDPPREEAKQAVLEAKRAGITPIMVTGDNEFTALAIAKEVGLIEHDEDVMTGNTLEKLSDETLMQLLPKMRVFARTKPEDKLRLTTLYKKLGFVVGVTGDGVNDALALKKADVGIAMGESGTDVAKEAADIVLLDDNFATIVKAVEEGRKIYDNIVKAITYLLSGNLSELSLVLFASLLNLPPVLLPTQILWINLVTDGLPALALASDTHNGNVLHNNPRDPKSQILTTKRSAVMISIGLGLALVLLFIYKFLLGLYSETFSRTVTFNLLVFFHFFLVFFVRKGSILKPSKMIILTILGTAMLQIIITTVPFFQSFFHLGF